jgi:outer membrane protein OmpA-like peptidoglycan-associated protein
MNINYIKGLHQVHSQYTKTIRNITLGTLMVAGLNSLQAQEPTYEKPAWRFGVAAGANINFYEGTTQQLNSDLYAPAPFKDGFGVGLFVAPLIEYHHPDSYFGVMLQTGYDNRQGKFDQITLPCNCPADLSTNLSYLTIEPSLRFAPFKSDLYFYAGPRLAFNLDKSFTYKQGINPDFPEQVAKADVNSDFSSVEEMLVSMQIGAGYDIQLSSPNRQTKFMLSPFVSFQPYFGQDPRSIESMNITTVRVGAALKFGRGKSVAAKSATVYPDNSVAVPQVTFTVNSPENIPADRRVRETFPLRNYVFFDLGSNEIPKRYVLLNQSEVKDFKEDQLEVFSPKSLTGRSNREMVVYYNILNILGDRMQKNPAANITLIGASEEGAEDGKAMAKSISDYLTSVFGINSTRIALEGRVKPKDPSEQPDGTRELELLRQGDRRVTIESRSSELLMEFQTGEATYLKPVEINAVQTAPIDSYVTFNVDGADESFTSWTLEIKDEQGKVQNFGPYTEETVSIPGKSILGTRPQGDYKVKMIGKAKSGKSVEKNASVHMVLWTPSENEQGMRYSVIYEFNESNTIPMYEKYLADVVTPKIPKNAKVVIQGYTDIIGDAANNKALSLARANDVKSILEKSLTKTSRTDVKFEVRAFGEDENLSPFNNKYPEERFYNRTVIIDIIPQK